MIWAAHRTHEIGKIIENATFQMPDGTYKKQTVKILRSASEDEYENFWKKRCEILGISYAKVGYPYTHYYEILTD